MNIKPVALLEPNMSISRNIYEGRWENRWVTLAQDIAIGTIIPFTLVVLFEAVIKNLIFITLANVAITLLNISREKYHARFGN